MADDLRRLLASSSPRGGVENDFDGGHGLLLLCDVVTSITTPQTVWSCCVEPKHYNEFGKEGIESEEGELTDFGEKNRDATVRVRWTSHPLGSLVVKETSWKEEWEFNRNMQRWYLLPGPGSLEGLPEDCLPDLGEQDGSEESSKSDMLRSV